MGTRALPKLICSLARPDPLPYREGEKGSGDFRQHSVVISRNVGEANQIARFSSSGFLGVH